MRIRNCSSLAYFFLFFFVLVELNEKSILFTIQYLFVKYLRDVFGRHLTLKLDNFFEKIYDIGVLVKQNWESSELSAGAKKF